MAMKNHPDKVANLGPDVQIEAEERFRKIQEAYELTGKEKYQLKLATNEKIFYHPYQCFVIIHLVEC